MTASIKQNTSASQPFIILAIVSIILGGMLSAFFAHDPSRIIMWVSAFLVLVLGIGQLALGYVINHVRKQPEITESAIICALYNASCYLIIIGTVQKASLHYFVALGSLLLLASLIGHFKISYKTIRSEWKILYSATMIILFISIIVGNVLSYL